MLGRSSHSPLQASTSQALSSWASLLYFSIIYPVTSLTSSFSLKTHDVCEFPLIQFQLQPICHKCDIESLSILLLLVFPICTLWRPTETCCGHVKTLLDLKYGSQTSQHTQSLSSRLSVILLLQQKQHTPPASSPVMTAEWVSYS
jgi:hypothetical protein